MLTEQIIREKLVIDDLIVPADVTISHLKGYTEEFLDTIEAAYQQIKAEEFSRCEANKGQPASQCIIIAGSHGVGKSHLAKQIMKERGFAYVDCDADRIMTKFPGFQEAIRNAEINSQHTYESFLGNNFNVDPFKAARAEVERATLVYRKAAKYISDRLMAECLREGVPVLVETTAQNPNIGNWLANIQATGKTVEVIIAQAPSRIKLAASEQHFLETHNVAVAKEAQEKEHAAFEKNMPVLAQASVVSIYWRMEANAPLEPVAFATKHEYSQLDLRAAEFNGYHVDRDISVKKLFKGRTALVPVQSSVPSRQQALAN